MAILEQRPQSSWYRRQLWSQCGLPAGTEMKMMGSLANSMDFRLIYSSTDPENDCRIRWLLLDIHLVEILFLLLKALSLVLRYGLQVSLHCWNLAYLIDWVLQKKKNSELATDLKLTCTFNDFYFENFRHWGNSLYINVFEQISLVVPFLLLW